MFCNMSSDELIEKLWRYICYLSCPNNANPIIVFDTNSVREKQYQDTIIVKIYRSMVYYALLDKY